MNYPRILIIKKNFSNKPPNIKYKKEDNPLLTPDKIVKGKYFGTLADIKTADLPNQPGVYVIRNKNTNMHLVGESKNLKDRIPKYSAHLKNKTAKQKLNQKFSADVDKYGFENFEILLVEYGSNYEQRSARLSLEARLQQILLTFDLCYNTGYNETKTERPSGTYPNSPGIYRITNIVDDITYIGETGQRKGLSQRFRNWKANLAKGAGKNQKLQADWDRLGQEAFTFEVVCSGPQWDDDVERKTEEARLVNQYRSLGKSVYNFSEEEKKAPYSNLRARETILHNQSPEYRKKMSDQKTGRPNLEGRKAVVIDGNVYLSVSEAAEALNYGQNRNPIKKAIQNGKYPLATAEQIAAEEKRRATGEGPIQILRKRRTTTGHREKILINLPEKNINNVVYDSLSDAAAALQISVQAVSKAVKTERPGYTKIQ